MADELYFPTNTDGIHADIQRYLNPTYPQTRLSVPPADDTLSQRIKEAAVASDNRRHSHGPEHGLSNGGEGSHFPYIPVDADGSTTINSPLGVLEEVRNIDVSTPLRYPIDIESAPRFAHAMKISIFKPQTSKYNITVDETVDTSAFNNRREFNQAIPNSGLVNPAVVGTVVGIQTGLNALSAGTRAGSLTSGLTAGISAVGAGVLAGGITAFLQKKIDLSREAKRLKQNIYLYTPQQVIFTQQHKYSEQSATAALGALGFIAQAGGAAGAENFEISKNSTLSQLATKLGNIGRNITNSDRPFSNELGNLLAGNAARTLGIIGEGAQDLLLQSQGFAQNPQMEVLFDTTDFRQFTFEFDFMPRSVEEANEVLKIVKVLRFYSAPELYRESARYFIPPFYFEIEFLEKLTTGTLQLNTNLPKITTCVLEQIDIDYVGESDRFVSHKDGIPVHMKMTLRFKEIEIIHKGLVEAGY